MRTNKKNNEIVLSKDNYYERPISKLTIQDNHFEELISTGRKILHSLIQKSFNSIQLDPENPKQIQSDIESIESLMHSMDDKNPEKSKLKNQVDLLTDLNKINQLELYNIPQDNESHLIYCSLAEKVSGATEKIALISLVKVKKQLHQLFKEQPISIEDYFKHRESFILNTEAIIKLPKHGNIKEIQHEAIALNISRLMGLDTTKSTTVSYNGNPALFIPFDDIRVLSEYCSGKTISTLFGFLSSPYTHYSTIKTIGEGVQADQYVDDFGGALALFYLCNDTDALGGYCQNKALKNSKSLFIFDQIMMEDDKLMLDSRLSLQPTQFILKHTRHGRGRNRTIIEDSCFENKFASIVHLITHEEKIKHYLDEIVLYHQARLKEITTVLNNKLPPIREEHYQSELKNVLALEHDALLLKSKIQDRILQAKQVLPKSIGAINSMDIRQGLILEKLLHLPILFTDDGRPYKNPWTYRQPNKLISITEYNEDQIELEFTDKIPDPTLNFIMRHCNCSSLNLVSSKHIIIEKNQLHNINETCLYPEHHMVLYPNINYLDTEDLAIISEAYGNGDTEHIVNIIKHYLSVMDDQFIASNEKLSCITATEQALKKLILDTRHKGFGMHVLKKYYFDSQLQLQKMISPIDMPEHLNLAFAVALKLDRVSLFNQVILEAIAQNKLNDVHFSDFINYTLTCSTSISNYLDAQKQSQLFALEAQKTLKHLELPNHLLIIQMDKEVMQAPSDDEIFIRPFMNKENILHRQFPLFNKVVNQQQDNIQEQHTKKLFA